jgi:hypothetical protein
MSVLRAELDKGNIAILCLDMYFIRDETKGRWHVDKFYPTANTGWGHFIVVKGYRMVDGSISLKHMIPTDSPKPTPTVHPRVKTLLQVGGHR